MFVFRRVAGIVHPIRPIHDGFPVENLGNLLVRLFREMLFSDRACDIMTFLSPRIAVDRHGKKTGSNADHLKYAVQFFHVANIMLLPESRGRWHVLLHKLAIFFHAYKP